MPLFPKGKIFKSFKMPGVFIHPKNKMFLSLPFGKI